MHCEQSRHRSLSNIQAAILNYVLLPLQERAAPAVPPGALPRMPRRAAQGMQQGPTPELRKLPAPGLRQRAAPTLPECAGQAVQDRAQGGLCPKVRKCLLVQGVPLRIGTE